ncbi:MAG: HI1506-related protein [Alphaproteobacteria bacterium]
MTDENTITPTKVIRVTNFGRPNFRRAGRAWSAGVTELMEGALTAEQIAQLEGDPQFRVELVDATPVPSGITAPDEDDGKGKRRGKAGAS